MKTYRTKTGAIQFKQSLETVTDVIENENDVGFCLACGAEQEGCEPDARKYICDTCGMPKVYGAEELLMMNLVH